jgi:soluble lytic murein transglycosylase-like protein
VTPDVQPGSPPESGVQGNVSSLTSLALRYEHAEGVPRDFARAIALYCRAARAGEAEALFRLGWIYANGRGVPRDEALAGSFFAMAADRGHEYAARMLRFLPAAGEGPVPTCLLPEAPHDEMAGTELAERLAAGAAPEGEMQGLVHRLAIQYGVDPRLALAIAAVESGFNPRAISPKNAQGLMQLLPSTADRFGVRNVFDPEENVRGGLAYLRWLLALFRGDVPLAVAAYNAGERAVERHRGVPPYAETREYVRRVTTIYRRAIHPFERGLVEPSPILIRLSPKRARSD